MQTDRYARQLLHWGAEKQQIIEKSSLLIAGVGGLGATVSQLLVRAGIGQLYLVDDGHLDWPDLNRQTLYGEKDVGRAKLPLAKERLNKINSKTEIVELSGRIDGTFQAPDDVDGVADCLDNYLSRFALYQALSAGTYFVHGGLNGDHGQVLTLLAGVSQAFNEIFAGAVQPQGTIPVTPDNVVIIAGLMVNELFSVLWKTPKLLDRCLVIDLGDLHLSFLDV
ncbi:MAG: HesA/MoeB/ThiF family protein [Desulfuromonadales bacterium]|nr:HesA/MoeB/ThiF family protein [Desulfuromonadales bacterium]